MKKTFAFVGLFVCLCFLLCPVRAEDWQQIERDFQKPPLALKSRPLWFWNKVPNREETVAQMKSCVESGYAGLAILPAFRDEKMKFMSPEFLRQYKIAADTAKELGIKLCLYDEFWFPSGSADDLMKTRYPEHLCKRLDMVAVDSVTENEITLEIPKGTLMGCVAMNRDTKKRTNITGQVQENVLRWTRPERDTSHYKIMAFVCILDGQRNLVDYLEPESVKKFIELTYAGYQKAMPEHFGTTIDSAFYDEPMLYTPGDGRAWTPKYNEYFQARFGYDPVPLYPAMFMDIGSETASARNALFGFRATLFSEGFVKTITDWLKPYGMPLTGHLDQEEVVNPTGVTGDAIKFFEYQDIPGLDQIFKYGRGSKMYKIISSAATNYDRNLVMTEIYGASGRISVDLLYRDAIDQAAKGVNMFVPHAVWYDPATMPAGMPPELSARDPLYAPILPQYNDFIGRIHLLMQKPARHVADIAILYPIESLQATYHFGGPISAYEGGVPGLDDNYQELGETLMFEQHRDFTFLHPETLRDRCKIVPKGTITARPSLQLTNVKNPAEFSTLIIPSMSAISCKTLEKIHDFYNAGGSIVATGMLPKQSVEPGKEKEVEKLLREIFGNEIYTEGTRNIEFPYTVTASSEWKVGGYAPQNVLNTAPETRWNSAAGSGNEQWLEIRWTAPRLTASVSLVDTFNRVRKFHISTRDLKTGEWVERVSGETIENNKRYGFPPQRTDAVRVDLDQITGDCVSISNVGLYDDQNTAFRFEVSGCDKTQTNAKGGKASFVRETMLSPGLRLTQKQALSTKDRSEPDVTFLVDEKNPLPNSTATGSLMYRHHRVGDRDIYFFGNSTDSEINVPVSLRGEYESVSWWNPHTGEITPINDFSATKNHHTVVRLKLSSVSSVFLVGKNRQAD